MSQEVITYIILFITAVYTGYKIFRFFVPNKREIVKTGCEKPICSSCTFKDSCKIEF